ncbi:SR-related and CTD-associated factor 4b isoform X1, partial [Tachysurus ichikawai]
VSAVSTESALERTNSLPADPVAPSLEDSVSAPQSQTRPLPLNRPPVLPPSFIPPFPNILHPPPRLPPPTLSRAPALRVRLPMPDTAGDFTHPGFMEAERWNIRPFRNMDSGPPRGPPEWFGPEPPFRRGGWSRGGPWGHGQFRN